MLKVPGSAQSPGIVAPADRYGGLERVSPQTTEKVGFGKSVLRG